MNYGSSTIGQMMTRLDQATHGMSTVGMAVAGAATAVKVGRVAADRMDRMGDPQGLSDAERYQLSQDTMQWRMRNGMGPSGTGVPGQDQAYAATPAPQAQEYRHPRTLRM